jgi:hypothetical protein
VVHVLVYGERLFSFCWHGPRPPIGPKDR